MKQQAEELKRNRSGQLLLVAALVIAVLVSTTTVYVYNIVRETDGFGEHVTSDVILAIKQSTRNAMISSLANVSRGGDEGVLEDNLDHLSSILGNLYQMGTPFLSFNLQNGTGYSSGILMSWDVEDAGMSSVCADLTLEVNSLEGNVTLDFTVNVTTSITIRGLYSALGSDEKLVDLQCRVFNEGEPARASNISLYYEDLGAWIPVDASNNLTKIDNGDGTYLFSFVVNATGDIPVSAHVYDLRQVFVRGNTTCTEA